MCYMLVCAYLSPMHTSVVLFFFWLAFHQTSMKRHPACSTFDLIPAGHQRRRETFWNVLLQELEFSPNARRCWPELADLVAQLLEKEPAVHPSVGCYAQYYFDKLYQAATHRQTAR
jgi:hypothetical protein